jgi:hypothetical protein
MRPRIGSAALLVGIFAFASVAGWAESRNEPEYLGKPFSYWLNTVETRDTEKIETAFDAMVAFGPEARKAVPALVKIVAEPFAPIQLGSDSESDILLKVENIHLRAGAIDSLAAIGEAAAPSTRFLIEWALKARVLPPESRSAATDRFYVDLVAIDVLERMRVAGAVAQFGIDAAPAVQALLESPNPEERKLSVAILNSGALPIAADLIKDAACEKRALGVSLMTDMWPVIAMDHLIALREMFVCPEKSKVKNARLR